MFVVIADHSSRASNVDVSRPERCSLWWVSFSAHAFGVCILFLQVFDFYSTVKWVHAW